MSVIPALPVNPGDAVQGKVSWFGGPGDSSDSGHTASGVPEATPGIAIYNRATLGGYYRVTDNRTGRSVILQQTDLGPAPWTGRKIDVTYSALGKFGYNQQNFPTDHQFTAVYLGRNPPTGAASGTVVHPGSAHGAPAGQQSQAQPAVQYPTAQVPDLTGLIQALQSQPQEQRFATPLQEPYFAARAPAAEFPVVPGHVPQPTTANLLAQALASLQIPDSSVPQPPAARSSSGGAGRGAAPDVRAAAGARGGGFIPANQSLALNRVDEGQDLQTTPGGVIIAPGAGFVREIKSDPGGFGPNYPVVHFTSGPYAGMDIYIGHTHAVLQQGQHFQQGQVLSHTGYGTNEGNAHTPGWAEIGDASTLGQGDRGQGVAIHPHFVGQSNPATHAMAHQSAANVLRAGARVWNGGTPGQVLGSPQNVLMAPGANQPATTVHPAVAAAAHHLASTLGHGLTVARGTNGNSPVHAAGHAVDIPASGSALSRLGRGALAAFGMDPALAARQGGGAFHTVHTGFGNVNIAFNTAQHPDSLHLGVTPAPVVAGQVAQPIS